MIHRRQPCETSCGLALGAPDESEPDTASAPVEPVLALPHSPSVCQKTGADIGIKFASTKDIRESVRFGLMC